MQVHHKPQLNKEDLLTFLKQHWPRPITKLESLVEGEDSQALYFDAGERRYVLRINKSDYGFKKDVYAYEHFTGTDIPIPKVHQIGKLDDEHAYCISDFVTGTTIQDLDRPAVEALLPATLGMLNAISNIDISNTSGYGEIDLAGNGKASSWQGWLLTHIRQPDFDWDNIVSKGLIKRKFLNQVFDAFKRLVEQVPNERRLIHGDFGSNNILVRNNKIVAVLDWDAASYGDWLFGVAGAYYWRDHLMCMDVQAKYYEERLNTLPNYHARISCYQLRAALIEMYVQAQRNDQKKLDWHIRRCQQLLDGATQ